MNFEDSKFTRSFESRVAFAMKKLVKKSDKLLVACSGGKDSTSALFILKKLGYDVEAISVDAHIGCYTESNLNNLKQVCKEIGVKLHVISFRNEFGASLCFIRDRLKEQGHTFKSCTVCGVLRRYLLNKHSRNLDADYLVLGHNLDDVAQTMIMNLCKHNPVFFYPVTSKGKGFVSRVKPFYYIAESDIVKYSKAREFPTKYCRCPCAVEGYRFFVRDWLDLVEQSFPGAKLNIVERFTKKQKDSCPSYCEFCGEPSANNMCRACSLIKMWTQGKNIQ